MPHFLPPLFHTIKTMKTITIRSNFTGRQSTPTKTPGKSLTQQALKSECDINKIMSQFAKTGLLPEAMSDRKGSYGDFSQITSFHEAKSLVRSAHDQFMTLPSYVRNYFSNDPENLLVFLDNPDNQDKAVELGLTNPLPVTEPEPEPSTPPEPTT